MTNDPNKTLHPELQALLGHLHLASPRRRIRPLFDTREEAESLLEMLRAQGEEEVGLRIVWRLNYENFKQSEIRGWSVDADAA